MPGGVTENFSELITISVYIEIIGIFRNEKCNYFWLYVDLCGLFYIRATKSLPYQGEI